MVWRGCRGFVRLITVIVKAVVRGLAMGVFGILFVCQAAAREMSGGLLNWWLLLVLAGVFGSQATGFLRESERRDSIFLVPGWL